MSSGFYAKSISGDTNNLDYYISQLNKYTASNMRDKLMSKSGFHNFDIKQLVGLRNMVMYAKDPV